MSKFGKSRYDVLDLRFVVILVALFVSCLLFEVFFHEIKALDELLMNILGLVEVIESQELLECGALFVILVAESIVILAGGAVLVARAPLHSWHRFSIFWGSILYWIR